MCILHNELLINNLLPAGISSLLSGPMKGTRGLILMSESRELMSLELVVRSVLSGLHKGPEVMGGMSTSAIS